MGWWGTGIMQGDPPLDMECVIYRLMEVDQYVDDNKHLVVKALSEKQGFLFTEISKYKYKEDIHIGHEVLATMIMAYGVKMQPNIKSLLISSIEQDDWAKGDSERKQVIEKFISVISVYDGTPVLIKEKGLMQTIMEHIDGGKPGLVNVIPTETDETDPGEQNN